MKKKLNIFLAIILSVIDLILLSLVLAGTTVEGFNGLVFVLIFFFLLILAAAIRCVLNAIRDKGPLQPVPHYCEFCGREFGNETVCPNCGASRTKQQLS